MLELAAALAGLKGTRVLQVSAGNQHALVLLEGGGVVSVGHGGDGKLGHGDEQHRRTPTLIEALRGKEVTQVSAGGRHSLVLLEGGGVMSFGGGFANEGRLAPELIVARMSKVVTQVSAGSDHSLLLLSGGGVMSFGFGGHGRLGHGDAEGCAAPKLIAALRGKNARQVSAGGCHSLVLLEGGGVLAFGQGSHGELGREISMPVEDAETPRPIAVSALLGRKVRQVAAGGWHSLVLQEAGGVASFGRWYYGQLGHSDTEDRPTPKIVEYLAGA